MPFTSYFSTKPEDVQALYAYFKYAVTPAPVSNRASDIPFPLSMRWPLTYWRWLFATAPVPHHVMMFQKGPEGCGQNPAFPSLFLPVPTA
jgi:mono/diheme cytochrome c family protein